MDHLYYRDIIPDIGFTGQDVPAEVVVGAINAGQGSYASGLLVSVNVLGARQIYSEYTTNPRNLGSKPGSGASAA